MAFYLSPIVAIKEVDISTTIGAVSTSIGVEILRNTYKGPEMQQTFVSSEGELVSMFGEPTTNVHCYRDMLSAAGFLKYGNKLYTTRVLPNDATFAGTKVVSGGFDSFGADAMTLTELGNPLDEEMGNPDEFSDDVVVTDTSDMWMIASSRGVWGNKIRVATITKDDLTTVNDVAPSATDFYPYESDGVTLKSEYVGTVPTYYNFRATDSPLATTKDFLILVQSMEQGEDTWKTVETWNVSTNPDAVDDQGVSKFAESIINRSSQYIRVNFNETAVDADWTVSTNTFESFVDGTSGTIDIADGVSPATQMVALDLYSNPEELDVNIFIDGDKPLPVKKYMIQICESRLDCMAVLDCPYELVVNNRGNETTDLTDWRKGLGSFTVDNLNVNTSYASLYGNWVELYDKYSKKYRWLPSAGHVAGIYAHTDESADPWWAPAGLNRAVLTGIRRLAWNPQLGHRDMLYKNGINPIVSFAGQGKVVWGNKNLLDKSSSFNRINVRRLFIVLEKAISTASKYFLFEPNDEITRSQLTNMINPFLRDVKSRRGVYDYMVVCDESNNTAERFDRNELWCTIMIKPTKSAEFMVLQFVNTKSGASFDEIAAQV